MAHFDSSIERSLQGTPFFTFNPSFKEAFEALENAITCAKTIALCAHTKPDGDAFGSVLGMANLIKKAFLDKEVFCLLADNEAPSKTFSFLNIKEHFYTPEKFEMDFLEAGLKLDLFISLDTPLLKRLGHAAKIAEKARVLASIDHHLSREPFGEISVIDDSAPAAAFLVGEFLLFLQEKREVSLLDKETANYLFMALMTDTGGFRYQNTNPASLAQAAWLVEAGANPSQLSSSIYQNEPLSLLHLKARVSERISTYIEGRLSFSYATLADFEELSLRPTDADGLVDIVRSVRGSDIALFIKETEDGKTVRGNLRAKGDFDVSAIAAHFGGGGHKAAAGFSAKGKIDEVRDEVIKLARPQLENPTPESSLKEDSPSWGGTSDSSALSN